MSKNITKLSEKIIKELKPFCKKISVAGSIRRKAENPRDIDIVLIPKNKIELENFMRKRGKFIQGGEHESTWRVDRVKVELYYTSIESFGATLLAYSSEKGAGIGLRKIAMSKGFHLNQYGLYKNGKLIAGKTEREIYKALGRPYKEPWER